MSSRRIIIPAAAMCFGLGVIASAFGQSPQQRGFEPVEQRVEDEEPLSRSLRRVEPGLSTPGQGSMVYRRQAPDDAEGDAGSSRYYYIGRGVTAGFDRSQYIRVGRKGEQIAQKIPPDTVFHIGFPADAEKPGNRSQRQKQEATGQQPSARRIDARVDARVPASAARGANRPARPRAGRRGQAFDWHGYRRTRQVRQRSVLRAIDQALGRSSDGGNAADRK